MREAGMIKFIHFTQNLRSDEDIKEFAERKCMQIEIFVDIVRNTFVYVFLIKWREIEGNGRRGDEETNYHESKGYGLWELATEHGRGFLPPEESLIEK
jgi:hypothetical protein